MDYKKELADFMEGKDKISLEEITKKIDEIARVRAEEHLDKIKKDKLNPIVEMRALEMVTQSLGFAMAESLSKENDLIISVVGLGFEDHAICMRALHGLAVQLIDRGDDDESEGD